MKEGGKEGREGGEREREAESLPLVGCAAFSGVLCCN